MRSFHSLHLQVDLSLFLSHSYKILSFPNTAFLMCLCTYLRCWGQVSYAMFFITETIEQSLLPLQQTVYQLKTTAVLDPIIYGTLLTVPLPVCPFRLLTCNYCELPWDFPLHPSLFHGLHQFRISVGCWTLAYSQMPAENKFSFPCVLVWDNLTENILEPSCLNLRVEKIPFH